MINQAIHTPHTDLNPTDQTHALTVPDPDDPLQMLTLPLSLRGVTSLLHVRNVTADDFYNDDIPRIDLTLETLTWDPSTTLYEEQENRMTNHSGVIVRDAAVRGPDLVINALHSLTTDLADIMHNSYLHQVLLPHVNISGKDTSLNGHIQMRKTAPIDHMTLASRWMISPEKAKWTVQRTMQRRVRTCLNPMLARRFLTNDRMLCYKQLPHPVFTNTMFAGTTSKQGNKWAQAYATSIGWLRAHPLTTKSDAHESLSLLYHWDGVPLTMILDSWKEQTLGNFKKKLRDADCHATQTKPYSPWQQAAEGCIHKLKWGVSRKMMKTGSPKVLWDHCIELEALLCSNTSNDIYMTNGEVPETTMTGSTADISHICKFAWFDWVMLRDNIPTFPEEKLILWHYLGPATDVGSALTAKILKSNG